MRGLYIAALLGILAVFGAVAVTSSDAQDTIVESVCPSLVNQALQTLDQQCVGLGRNSACYGYKSVSAQFTEAVDETYFSKPSDRAELTKLQSIQTMPLNEAASEWGLALMNVQANVPHTLPGQGVVYLLMGDASVENRVDLQKVPQIEQFVTTKTVYAANIRSLPSVEANVLRSVPANVELQGDVLSPDGQWLRVLQAGVPGWVSREVIANDPTLEALPRPELTAMSPMQAFEFTGGIGETECREASGALLVQGPNNVVVDIEANGANIRIASTVLLNRTPNNDLRVVVLSGAANVDGVQVPAGFYTTAPLNAENQVSGFFSPAKPLKNKHLNSLQTFSKIPSSLMYYTVIPPSIEEIQMLTQGVRSQSSIQAPSGGAPQQNSNNTGGGKRNKKDKNKGGGGDDDDDD